MTKEERIARKLGHTKQERLQVKIGIPSVHELKESIPVLRDTSEGLVEYIRYKGILYKQILSRA